MAALVAAIAVDHVSHRVLMVAYMNREAFEETVRDRTRMLLLALAPEAWQG